MKSFTWGWITSDGVRCKSGCETNATPDKIIGIWGMQGNTHYETFLKECKPADGIVNNWSIRPLATLLDTNKERLRLFAKNKKLAINEICDAPKSDPTKKIFQKWECKCGHSFYTDLAKLPNFVIRMWAWVRFWVCPKLMDCESCHAKIAKEAGIVRKD